MVYDEGGAGEEAYYRNGMPVDNVDYSDTTSSFKDIVEAEILSKVTAGTIEKGSIRELDEEKKQAVVEVYMLDTGTLYNRLYFCWEDISLTLQFNQIVQQ